MDIKLVPNSHLYQMSRVVFPNPTHDGFRSVSMKAIGVEIQKQSLKGKMSMFEHDNLNHITNSTFVDVLEVLAGLGSEVLIVQLVD